MKTSKQFSGVILATAAAALFSIAPVTATAEEKQGKCIAGNSCKGLSSCHTATSACAGQNSCKGRGWIKTTRSDCEAKGGEFES